MERYLNSSPAPGACRKRRRLGSPEETDSASVSTESSQSVSRKAKIAPTQIDWRLVLCQSFNFDPHESDRSLLDNLTHVSTDLEEATRPKTHPRPDETYQILHRIRCERDDTSEICYNEPWPVRNDNLVHLRASGVVQNLELYLERHKAIVLLVYKDYTCCTGNEPEAVDENIPMDHAGTLNTLLVEERMAIVSETLVLGLKQLWSKRVKNNLHPPFETFEELSAPYLWWFAARDRIGGGVDDLSRDYKPSLKALLEYINGSFGEEYGKVGQLLNAGRTMIRYLPYLYYLIAKQIPGELQLSKLEGRGEQFYQAFTATSWLRQMDRDELTNSFANNDKEQLRPTFRIKGLSWEYNGAFYKKTSPWVFNCEFNSEDSFDITSLDVYPLRYADERIGQALKRRGLFFWACRRPKYICYHEQSTLSGNDPDERYMIDYQTYKEMHVEQREDGHGAPGRNNLAESAAEGAPIPDDGMLLCLPTTLPGYHMRKKKWYTLYVSRMSDVQWNSQAFERLVIDTNKKQLIRALVTTKITTEKADLIGGKGNGLFILLHGGPGTGKTLTAESVAEIARKPLYRVTCGDVGTRAEEVETYLETVLLLGQTWGCVVLLDEADIFLMQRSVEDFKRNALVSVFLRVLEYYDGILILTSNRVGTFDAAFKSRIQLSLHYSPLGENDRSKVWTNLLEHINDQIKPGDKSRAISYEQIMGNLQQLAKRKLNGREIRNALSTARQLAIYQSQPMGLVHLEAVLGEMKKFEEYAIDLKGGVTDAEIAWKHQEY